ncbi:hypothetical protein CGS54_10750 [Faecalibacterium prausnitzii]|uniref:Uncharacterized protein n=1 Tax=Faecalibacterium prausnitzii TaxID=853 RepID=A0A2J4JN38_9FIRM|nr:hypothetical protein CGS54_10750 [Faecalibacterium prausnitzii]PLK29282.1 hypothetical protein CGS50_009120 [Faecalibacterium prausnitzii]
MNAFIVSTLVFLLMNGAASVPAHSYSSSIADLAKFEHTFCKKEQTRGEKDILSQKLGAIFYSLCYTYR